MLRPVGEKLIIYAQSNGLRRLLNPTNTTIPPGVYDKALQQVKLHVSSPKYSKPPPCSDLNYKVIRDLVEVKQDDEIMTRMPDGFQRLSTTMQKTLLLLAHWMRIDLKDVMSCTNSTSRFDQIDFASGRIFISTHKEYYNPHDNNMLKNIYVESIHLTHAVRSSISNPALKQPHLPK